MKKQSVVALVETGIFVGIAVVLDTIFGAIYTFPSGGSIGFTMLPIFIVASRRGPKYGLLAGLLLGLIQTAIKVYFLNFLQYFFDYIVAFTVLGVGAFIPNTLKKANRFVWLIIIGSGLRLIAASLAGVAFWASYIQAEMEWVDSLFGSRIATTLSGDSLLYIGSFVYNSLYMIPSMILTAILGYILHKRGLVQYNLINRTS